MSRYNTSIPTNFLGTLNARIPDDAAMLFDDFMKLDTDLWSSITNNNMSCCQLSSTIRGILNVKSGSADNNYHLITTKKPIIAFDTGKQSYIKAKVSLTEANTDDANIIFGVSSVTSAGNLIDDAGGPAATYDGAVFFKVDGGTVWQAEYSDAGTQTTDTNCKAFTTATDYVLEIWYDGRTTVSFCIDDVEVHTATVIPANLDDMYIIFGVKAGGANQETLSVDYIYAIQER